jgi:hypothetical protein
LPAGGGRVLLSLPSTDEKVSRNSFEYQSHSKHHVDSLEDAFRSKYPSAYSGPATPLSALWRRQNYDFVGTIYPPPEMSNNEEDFNHTSTQMNKEKKHLRFRPVDKRVNNTTVRLSPVSHGVTEKQNVKSPDVSVDGDKDKVLTLYRKSGNNSPGGEVSQLSSKILLSEGRVLLNPVIANLHASDLNKDRNSGESRNSHEEEHDKAIIPSIPRIINNSPLRDDTDLQSNNNHLTMMIPASTIQWGFEWLDDSSPDNSDLVMQHLLKTLNISTMDHHQDTDKGHDNVDI